MSTSRISRAFVGACTTLLLAGCGASGSGEQAQAAAAGIGRTPGIGGQSDYRPGLPNPAPNVTRNWGQLPAGRSWGTTAGIDIDPKDGNVWAYERCGAGAAAAPAAARSIAKPTPVDPIFKFDRNTGAVLANFGKGVMVTPHGISVDKDGNVWVADFSGNKAGTKGHQVHKFSPKGEKLLSLGIAGKPGNADGQFNQPNDVVVGPDGSIYVADGHDAQGMTTTPAIAEGLKRRDEPHQQVLARRQVHQVVGEDRRQARRVPHAACAHVRREGSPVGGRPRQPPHRDLRSGGELPRVALQFSRPSGFFIKGDTLYVIDSESGPLNHPNWRDGVRIGPVDEDRVVAFIPPFEREDRVYQGVAGEGVAVDADGNVFAAEGPNSFVQAGGAFTRDREEYVASGL